MYQVFKCQWVFLFHSNEVLRKKMRTTELKNIFFIKKKSLSWKQHELFVQIFRQFIQKKKNDDKIKKELMVYQYHQNTWHNRKRKCVNIYKYIQCNKTKGSSYHPNNND